MAEEKLQLYAYTTGTGSGQDWNVTLSLRLDSKKPLTHEQAIEQFMKMLFPKSSGSNPNPNIQINKEEF